MTNLPAPALSERKRWQAFGIAVAVAALTILDLSKVNVGLPSIESSLGAGSSELQAIVAGYALAFGLALVPAGRLGDLHSRKAMFLIGLAAFTATSLLCALAPNTTVLMVGRFLQGIAAGIQMPQVLGLVQQLFQGAERGRAFGVFGATIGLSTAFGPTVGGLLIAAGGPQDGWRLLFWMNIPLGLVLMALAVRLLPGRQLNGKEHRGFDPVGVLLLGATTLSLMLPFVLTTGAPSDDPRRWLLLLVAIISAGLFVRWERRYLRSGRSPVVHFSLFGLGSYRNGILIAAAYFAALPATFLLTTLYLQQGLGLAPVFAGMVTIPFALSSAVSAYAGGRLVERRGRSLVVLGLLIVTGGFGLVLAAAVLPPAEWSPWLMSAALAVAGTGGGLVIAPNQTLTLAEIPLGQAGVAGSIAQVGQRVGTAVGVAAVTAVFFSTLYAEASDPNRIQLYHDGFRNGILVALALIVTALALGILDLRQRRRAAAE